MTEANPNPALEPDPTKSDPAPEPDPKPEPSPDPNPDADPAPDPEPESDPKADWPETWREMAANGDEDLGKLAKRYGSVNGVLKALKAAQDTIRSGKIKRDMPDASDEKAMSEWRKEQGIPDDPTGYVFPEPLQKKFVDEDKPLLASFTDFAHKKALPTDVVSTVAEWYVENAEAASEAQAEADRLAAEAAEGALRKDWAHPEYKANLKLAHRFVESIPGLGTGFALARTPDGKRLVDNPAFIAWASDQGRGVFGDVTFASADSEARHNSRKAEIEQIRNTDFDRYESEGLDKEYRAIIEKELKRAK